MLAALPIATSSRPLFLTGEATEDGLEGDALLVPHHRHLFDRGRQHALVRAELRKSGPSSMPTMPGARAPTRIKLFIEKAGGSARQRPGAARYQGLRALPGADPRGSEVVLPAFIGSLSVAFYTQAKAMGIDKKVKMFSSSASWNRRSRRHPGRRKASISSRTFRACWPTRTTSTTRSLSSWHRRRLLPDRQHPGDGQEPRLASWEDIYAIKQAVEASGQVRKDIEGAIQALEGMQMKNSSAPRATSSSAGGAAGIMIFHRRVENRRSGRKRIPKEELAANMPLRHNLSTMPV
jgi:branched-chain amino acid transport system substrate-binding protein